MANDPAFLFYPGDYLRDTQCLSERSQVAYDRIMCEHMRNICISQTQLDFFTKRLTADEKLEVLMVVVKIDCGYHIPWVTDSIRKRRDYSESRRKNKLSTPKIKTNISSTYVQHMDNVIENENEIVYGLKNESRISIRKIFANGKIQTIYDMQVFFYAKSQLEDIERAKWTKYTEFMQANPGRVFDDEDHLYNSYKLFNTAAVKTGTPKKLTFEDLN